MHLSKIDSLVRYIKDPTTRTTKNEGHSHTIPTKNSTVQCIFYDFIFIIATNSQNAYLIKIKMHTY